MDRFSARKVCLTSTTRPGGIVESLTNGDYEAKRLHGGKCHPMPRLKIYGALPPEVGGFMGVGTRTFFSKLSLF